MGAMQIIMCLYGLAYHVMGAPAPKADGELLTFKDGNIGVNFLGFKASAGLGGLLSGDGTQGGLHAEAETPFGQRAGAGLGGRVDGSGRSIGGLYAGATAIDGVGAEAGLGGVAGGDGAFGGSYAGASAGGVGKAVIKERVSVPAAGASISSSLNIQKVAAPSSTVDIEVVKEVPPAVQKTYVERTVIPNYVEKTIQVPSYVEKTIRVPTLVEKRVKVPAPPTIIEKEVEVPHPVKTVTKQVYVEHDVPATTIVKTKTRVHRRPWKHFSKYLSFGGGAPYYGGVVAGGASAGASANAVGGLYRGFGSYGNLGSGAEYYDSSPVTYTVRKQFNGNLVRDIFNIPLSTIGAVSNLVGNIADGTGGSVSVSKSFNYKK